MFNGSLIIDDGPHTVLVFPEIVVTDSRGNERKKPADTGILVRGVTMMPLASTRGAFAALQVTEGQTVDAAWRMFARTAPVGWWSRVEWRGIKLSILGGPLMHTMSDGTSHMSATLKEER